jgi:HKD family nuclease
MVKIEPAKLPTLLDTLGNGRKSIICTPFFTREGLDLIGDFIKNSETVDILIRSNIYDWANGFADLSQLREFIQFLCRNEVKIQLHILSNLHAKVYACEDLERAYFGSANLTIAAFSSNLEIMTYVDGEDSGVIFDILADYRKSNPTVDVDDFLDMIEVTTESVERIGAKLRETDYDTDDDFNAAVDLFSQELHKRVRKLRWRREGAGRRVEPNNENNFVRLGPRWPTLEEFIEYSQREKSPGAQEIVARYHGKSNLQGHIKHMFYGGLFFFYENPSALDKIPPDLHTRERVLWSDESWIEEWVKYLNRHTGEFYDNISFNYHTLVTYLPTTLGGIQQSGGASSGNFKKVIALLSKMLRENHK